MKGPIVVGAALLWASAICLASSNGAWLKKVPAADRQRTNPYAGQPEAVDAGKNLFRNNCAKCHGAAAEGKGSRPSLRSERLKAATDGEMAWIIKNGQTFKGMPSWGGLPDQMRWQLVAYLRSLNPPANATGSASGKEGGK
jgi:mono/diheme cytochrome c family protein